jgi:PAS domain S-box-containing protein
MDILNLEQTHFSHSLIEASLDPIVIINTEGQVTASNYPTTHLTGLKKEDLLSRYFFDLFTDPIVAEKLYKEVLAQGIVSTIPLSLKHKNNKLFQVFLKGSLFKNHEGEIIGAVVVLREIPAIKAKELNLSTKELAYQEDEKEKRADELNSAMKDLAFQNEEKYIREIENSQYSRSLIEACTDPILTISPEGKITDVNEASVKVTGEMRENLIGADFSDYFTEPKKAREVYKQVFKKGTVSDYPLTIKHKNGTLTDVLYNASVYKDTKGIVLGVFAAARDITTQKRIEANLEKSLKEISSYKRALDESSIVAITDQNGEINYVNDNFCKISKFKREELIGQDHRIINSAYHPEKFMKDLWATITSGKIWTGEVKNKAKDGTFYWLDTTIVPFLNEKGEVYQYVAIRTDITAKKLLSQYSLSLIEASRDPLVAISPEGKITDMNEATVNVTGVSREKLKGSDFKDYFTDPKKASEVYQEVFAKGFVSDYPLTMKDHNLTDVLFNGSVYKDDRGNVLGAVIVARDITEQKRIEKELRESKEIAELTTIIAEDAKRKAENATLMAINAVKAKQQFLSNMSHEIRTPMNAIIGFTKVLLKTEINDKQNEYLEAIKLSGDALIVLINDILDLAKVDSGKMSFEHAPFKLKHSINAMLHLFEAKIQEKNLKLVEKYDTNIPEVLLGDPIRLHQIILNLISNAVKFTNIGKINVSVNLVSEDDKKVCIEFLIQDSGIGIEAIKIPAIFEDFQQASSGTARLYGGTGLGLAIVKQLVEKQGGSISVKSEVNVGSTFSFKLNFSKTKAEAQAIVEDLELDMELKNIRVLVVEDLTLNQLLMRTILEDFNFECDIAANGIFAIKKLEEKTYDIILMDLQMPEMNGFEATEYIRNTLKLDLPIIALTADVTTVDLEKCKLVGMNDFLSKPVDDRVLYTKIVNLVKPTVVLEEKNETGYVEVLKPKCINLSYLSTRTKSNPMLMMEMITLYLEQTPPLVKTMKQSFLEKNWELMQVTVHKMIPSFSIVGISSNFENMAKKLQKFARLQDDKEEIVNLVSSIENICTQACAELKEELITIKTKQQ